MVGRYLNSKEPLVGRYIHAEPMVAWNPHSSKINGLLCYEFFQFCKLIRTYGILIQVLYIGNTVLYMYVSKYK